LIRLLKFYSAAGSNIELGSGTLTLGGSVSYAGTIAGTGGLVFGTGTSTLSGTNTYSGDTTVNTGTVVAANNASFGTSTISFLNGGKLAFGAAGLDLANDIELAPVGPTVVNTGSYSGTLSGVISGVGILQKTGSGTLTLDGTNTYSSGTTIQQGTVVINNDSALGTGPVTFVGGNLSFGGDITELSNNMSLVQSTTINTSTYTGLISGIVSGSGGLTKTGEGTLGLSGANTYTGTTTIAGGTLRLRSNDAYSSDSALVLSLGTFDLNGYNATVANLSGAEGTTIN
jgi:autotransporter-associated beta strand protein